MPRNLQHIRFNSNIRPREGGAPGKLWKSVSSGAESLQHDRNVHGVNARGASPPPRTQMASANLHPFKVYQLPPRYRPAPDPSDWLKVRVRSGKVIGSGSSIDVGGTDGCTPDQETYAENPNATDILVPANDPRLHIWVRSDGATAALYSGDIPATALPQPDPDWNSFPQNDAKHTLIATVDSQTYAAKFLLNIRQLVRADIITGAGGGGGAVLMQVESEPPYDSILNTTPANSPLYGYFNAHAVTAAADKNGVITYAAAGGSVKVAKPQYLRSQPFQTPAVSPAIIQPPYVRNRLPYNDRAPVLVWCVQNPTGGTGVADPDNPGQQLSWLDLNIDARTWGYPISVCIGGAGYTQLFAASPPYIPPGGAPA